MLALLLAALLQTPATPPQASDSVDVPPPPAAIPASAQPGGVRDDDGVSFRPRVAPSALYSTNRGFGIGGGVGIRNLAWTGSDLVVDLRLQQRYQAADVTFFTADPYTSPVHFLVSAGASTTSRQRYFGLGPYTVADSEIQLYHDAAQAEVRAGVYPLGTTGLYLQPGVRFLYDYTDGVNEEASENDLDVLDPASRAAVRVAEDRDRYGLSPGFQVATDLRDWPAYPRRGTLVAAEYRRFFALDDSDLTFNRYSASVANYIPIRGRTTVILRAVGTITRSGDADGDGLSDPIPFYYLPTLDDRVATAFQQDRLTGRDVVAAGVGVRAPIFDFLGVYGVDALVIGYLGNAYDNVFEEFTPAVTFEEGSVLDAEGNAALRPSLGLGLGLINLDKERVVLGGLLGVGPGGVKVATLRVAYDLRDARPLFR